MMRFRLNNWFEAMVLLILAALTILVASQLHRVDRLSARVSELEAKP